MSWPGYPTKGRDHPRGTTTPLLDLLKIPQIPRIFLNNPQNPGIFCNIQHAILTKSPELLQNPRKSLHDVVDMLRIPRIFLKDP